MTNHPDVPQSERHKNVEFTGAQHLRDALHSAETEPSVEKAAGRISAWYEALGPRLGAYLTNPNVVLTLANARGFTEFATSDFTQDDVETFARLNALSQPQGIYFEPHIIENDGMKRNYVELINLPGLDYTSSRTRLPGVPRYGATEGREGMNNWNTATQRAVDAGREHGQYPPETASISTTSIVVASGVARGYPDEAIMAVLQETNRRTTQVPFSTYYSCEQPNYSYSPSDEGTISQHVEAWGRLLGTYYRSATHARLESNEEFRRAREAANES